ncbi:hypothetical protein LptCag_1694 [Leptospirillum ferriphilum]|jgi:hypothetical protein|uniref:Uncharacterized protein n=2 Tax=Leptospirillum ferriphilum TaxID=178606 RepID=A0A094W8N5_9BACT|nr:hypothetical protein LFML04_1716 [Leptospirillum ferriphilum ML-04]KGA92860.1 hypothetical protein LptCag_1694 [Leptospirillum ferriphilum]OOH73587.1 hypothetical protein BOX24_03665 [Leptospirillum ferriphilum]
MSASLEKGNAKGDPDASGGIAGGSARQEVSPKKTCLKRTKKQKHKNRRHERFMKIVLRAFENETKIKR